MMPMLDIGTKIANMVTIMIILCYSAYLYASAKEAKYHILAFYSFLVFRFKPVQWMWKNDKINFFIYLTIPVLFSFGLILLSQLHDGIFKIRYDFQVFSGAVLWFLLLSKEKFQHDLICTLQDKIKELKEKLNE